MYGSRPYTEGGWACRPMKPLLEAARGLVGDLALHEMRYLLEKALEMFFAVSEVLSVALHAGRLKCWHKLCLGMSHRICQSSESHRYQDVPLSRTL
jgi:hypothetical protein